MRAFDTPSAAAAAAPATAQTVKLTLEDHALIDWAAVAAIRDAVSNRIMENLKGVALNRADHGELAQSLIREEIVAYNQARLGLGEPSLTRDDQLRLHRGIDAAIFGAGRMQPLLELDGLEDLLVAGHRNVRLEFSDGSIVRGAKIADSDQELIELISHIAETMSGGTKSFSTASPVLNMTLPDDSRLAAVILASEVPRISIRKHSHVDHDLADLLQIGMIDRGLLALLTAAITAGKTILVSGLPGAGKTTLIRAILHQLPPSVHIGTIETKYELLLQRRPERHEFVTALQELLGNGEGEGRADLTVNTLIPIILQHSVQRVALGEILGPEILVMLKVMQATSGSVSTVHANNAADAIERLVTLMTEVGPQITERLAYRRVAEVVDLIVHAQSVDQRHLGGRRHRFVSEVTIPALHGDSLERGISAEQIYAPGPDGRAVPTGVRPPWIGDLTAFSYDASRWLISGAEAWPQPLELLGNPEVAW